MINSIIPDNINNDTLIMILSIILIPTLTLILIIVMMMMIMIIWGICCHYLHIVHVFHLITCGLCVMSCLCCVLVFSLACCLMGLRDTFCYGALISLFVLMGVWDTSGRWRPRDVYIVLAWSSSLSLLVLCTWGFLCCLWHRQNARHARWGWNLWVPQKERRVSPWSRVSGGKAVDAYV